MIKRGSETFSGYNTPKRTPGHKTKSHAVLAKSGDEVKLIRFGQQGVSGSPDGSKRNEAFVGNWSPVRWVIGPGFYNQINGWDTGPEAQAILDKIKSTGYLVTDLDGKPLDLEFNSLYAYMMRSTTEL